MPKRYTSSIHVAAMDLEVTLTPLHRIRINTETQAKFRRCWLCEWIGIVYKAELAQLAYTQILYIYVCFWPSPPLSTHLLHNLTVKEACGWPSYSNRSTVGGHFPQKATTTVCLAFCLYPYSMPRSINIYCRVMVSVELMDIGSKQCRGRPTNEICLLIL